MTTTRLRVALLLMVVVGAACSSQGRKNPTPGRQRDLITRQEIMETPQADQDLFSAIRSLRPQFLASPPGVSRATAAPLVVYVNGVRQNSVTALAAIRASAAAEVRYLDPTAALNQYGPMASGGALVVKLYEAARPPETPMSSP